MQQRRRSKKSICGIVTFFGILMFVAQNELRLFCGGFYPVNQGTPVPL
jgi:hypothetical protein